jgi:hypothetical protein
VRRHIPHSHKQTNKQTNKKTIRGTASFPKRLTQKRKRNIRKKNYFHYRTEKYAEAVEYCLTLTEKNTVDKSSTDKELRACSVALKSHQPSCRKATARAPVSINNRAAKTLVVALLKPLLENQIVKRTQCGVAWACSTTRSFNGSYTRSDKRIGHLQPKICIAVESIRDASGPVRS